MTENKLKWNRRKEARPTEIIEAATQVFIQYGFAAAKLDDIATRAGVAKGTLYRYYDTKEDLFRAVVQLTVAAHLQAVEQTASDFQGSLSQIIPVLLSQAVGRLSESRIPALARLVVTESRTFPDLARIWYDSVVAKVLTLLTDLISKAQSRGEVRPGDPKVHAFSIVGPVITALLFRELFEASNGHAPDLNVLAIQHAETVLRGIIIY